MINVKDAGILTMEDADDDPGDVGEGDGKEARHGRRVMSHERHHVRGRT